MSEGGRSGVLELIASDIDAWAVRWSPNARRGTIARAVTACRLVWNYAGLRATIVYRVSHALRRHRVPLIPGMLCRWNIAEHGLDIPPSTPIGPGMYVPHPVGTVVTARRIGAGVTLVSNVTIGMRNEPTFPVIGDDVFIGAGARVLGGITIGDGASIGANAVVLGDVPSGCVAIGVPAIVRTRSQEVITAYDGSRPLAVRA